MCDMDKGDDDTLGGKTTPAQCIETLVARQSASATKRMIAKGDASSLPSSPTSLDSMQVDIRDIGKRLAAASVLIPLPIHQPTSDQATANLNKGGHQLCGTAPRYDASD